MKIRILPAACLSALAGLTISATVSLGGGDGGAASGLDLQVSGTATFTSGDTDIAVFTGGVPAAPTDNPTARFFAITMCTISCNVGTVLIPFQAAMQYNHPYISTNVYRVNAAGRLEQLTAAWIKHAFSSASASQSAVPGPNGQPACGTGSCGSGSGSVMGLNCSDTYGSGLNSGISGLGPRGEVRPNDPGTLPSGATFIGWNPVGSFFDIATASGSTDTIPTNVVGDGTKSYNGGSNQPWKYNLLRTDEVSTAALGPAKRVILETYYVLNGDVAKTNNHAWRAYTYNQPADVSGAQGIPSQGNFVQNGFHTFGAPVLSWGDQQQTAVPATNGQVFVASRVVDLGPGNGWRYEYNVYNNDFQNQINGVEIPIPSIVTPQNIGTWRPRQQTFLLEKIMNGASQTGWRTRWYDNSPWTMVKDDTKSALILAPVTIADNANPPAFTNPTLPNTIRWGTMYTFWYNSDMPPRTNGLAKLTPFVLTGGPTALTARISVPKVPSDITDIGGGGPPDGQPTVDDIIAFFNGFSDGSMIADISSLGGEPRPDGQLTVDDIILFINTFSDWQ